MEIKFETPLNFNFTKHRNKYSQVFLLVFGCGGTGSRLIPLLAQHVKNHNTAIDDPLNLSVFKNHIHLALIDFDEVEAKNLERQNFLKRDIGKNKADTLAERYSSMYGINIVSISQKIDDLDKTASTVNMLNMILDSNTMSYREANRTYGNENLFFLFDCTDNVNARQSIESFASLLNPRNKFNSETFENNSLSIDSSSSSIIISCGNEDTYGQVVVSNTVVPRYNKIPLFSWIKNKDRNAILSNVSLRAYMLEALLVRKLSAYDTKNPSELKTPITLRHLPSLLSYFTSFQDKEVSCANMRLVNEQSMPINNMMAQIAFSTFYNLISCQDFDYWMVKANLNNTFDTKTVNTPSKYLNLLSTVMFGNDDEASLVMLSKTLDAFQDKLMKLDSSTFGNIDIFVRSQEEIKKIKQAELSQGRKESKIEALLDGHYSTYGILLSSLHRYEERGYFNSMLSSLMKVFFLEESVDDLYKTSKVSSSSSLIRINHLENKKDILKVKDHFKEREKDLMEIFLPSFLIS